MEAMLPISGMVGKYHENYIMYEPLKHSRSMCTLETTIYKDIKKGSKKLPRGGQFGKGWIFCDTLIRLIRSARNAYPCILMAQERLHCMFSGRSNAYPCILMAQFHSSWPIIGGRVVSAASGKTPS